MFTFCSHGVNHLSDVSGVNSVNHEIPEAGVERNRTLDGCKIHLQTHPQWHIGKYTSIKTFIENVESIGSIEDIESIGNVLKMFQDNR